MKRHTQPGDAEHGQIISSVADCNCLLKGNSFPRSDLFQQLRLARSIDNFSNRLSCEQTAGEAQFIGVDVIKAEFIFELLGEAGKAAGEDGCLISKRLERS